jgi:hypothetical protein
MSLTHLHPTHFLRRGKGSWIRYVDSILGARVNKICQVYAEKAIYDDPWSYCDTRYKIAGQWYGGFNMISTLILGLRLMGNSNRVMEC